MWVSVCGSGRLARGAMLSVALASVVVGCGTTRSNPADAAGATAESGGSSGSAGSAGAGSVGGDLPLAEEAVPSEMHRLNQAEYRATVLDLLGSRAQLNLPPDIELNGFDNMAAALGMSPSAYEQFLSSAETVAAEVMSDPESAARVVPCDSVADDQCVHRIVEQTGLRLFRRPLFGEEIPFFEQVYTQATLEGESPQAALTRLLTALLASSQFLYRMELELQASGTRALEPYELASRLSYLLWSSAPDDELLATADAGLLATDAELAAQLERFWADPKSDRFAENFGGQWLRARQVLAHAADLELFPAWTPEVAAAAKQETVDYFNLFVREEQSFLGFLAGRPHPIGNALAPIYGIAASKEASGTVLLDEGERNGYLGSVTFLAVTSMPHRTSPTTRGRIVLDALLCSPPPPPPPDVVFQDPFDGPPPRNIREALEQHLAQAPCAACHRLMDPIGLAMEHYDGIGRYRGTYEDGGPIDTAVTLEAGGGAQPVDVDSLAGVADWVRPDPRFSGCLAKKLYTYGMSRSPGDQDARNLQILTDAWQQGPLTVKELVRRFVLAKPFRSRLEGVEP